MKYSFLIILCVLLAIGIAGRLLPHLPNATPIAAIAFASSMYLGRKAALLVPLIILLITDALLGFYAFELMLSVYASIAVVALISLLARKCKSYVTVGYLAVASSLFFFLSTNAAVWWFSPWYEKSFAGLLYSYELGLPFFRNMLMGDLLYTFGLLGAFALAPTVVTAGRKLLKPLQSRA